MAGALALLAEEDNLCAGCGQPRDESMDPAAEGTYRTRLIGCHACAEQQKAEADLREGKADHGIQVAIERA